MNKYSISKTIVVNKNYILVDNQTFLSLENKEDDFALQAYKSLNIQYPKFYKMDKMCKWGIICSFILLNNKELAHIDSYKKCLVFQNTSSSLLTDKNYQKTIDTIPSPALFVYTLPNIVMGEIAIKYTLKGENTFFVSEKKNLDQLFDYSNILFENEIAKVCIAAYFEITENDIDIEMFLLEKK